MQTALTRSYIGSKLLGYTFNMVGIPEGVDVGNDPLAFNPVQMRAAFEAGRALGAQDNPWHDTPTSSGDLPSWAYTQLKAP